MGRCLRRRCSVGWAVAVVLVLVAFCVVVLLTTRRGSDPGDFLNRPTPLRFRVRRWVRAMWDAVMRWLDDGMKGMPPPGFGAP